VNTPPVAVRLLVGGAVLVGLALSGVGLSKMVYFARTHETLSEARDGKLLLLVGCVVLLGCAVVVFSTGPHWAAVLIAAPEVWRWPTTRLSFPRSRPYRLSLWLSLERSSSSRRGAHIGIPHRGIATRQGSAI